MKVGYFAVLALIFVSVFSIFVLTFLNSILPKEEKTKNKFFHHVRSLWEKLKSDNVALSKGILLVVIILIVLVGGITHNPKDWRELADGVFVEMFGMLFDVLLLVLLFNWMNAKGEKKRKVQRYKEELDDYREWDESEAAHRVGGIIRRLDDEGIEDFELDALHLGKSPQKYVVKALNENIKLASLRGTKIRGENLNNTGLQYTDLREAILTNVDLKGATLDAADLQGARLFEVDLRQASLVYANLKGIRLFHCNLEGAILNYANLEDAIIVKSNLSNSSLNSSVLSKAILQEANLIGASMIDANLKEANLISAQLQSSDLSWADLGGAKLIDAEFQDAHFFEIKLDNCIVGSSDWLDKQQKCTKSGFDLKEKYRTEPNYPISWSRYEYIIKKVEIQDQKNQCNHFLDNGERCKRLVKQGKSYCFQHKK